jgi:hypothetical protein
LTRCGAEAPSARRRPAYQSIFKDSFARMMDGRVKPGHDAVIGAVTTATISA